MFDLPSSGVAKATAIAASERRGYWLCKKCRLAENSRNRRRKNGDVIRARQRAKYQNDPVARETRNARTRAWREKKRHQLGGSLTSLYRKQHYGLTEEAFTQLCDAYPICGICGRDCELDTDHCHKTGKVRGRLCTNCNTAIGKLGDDIPGLMRAVEYLASPKFQ